MQYKPKIDIGLSGGRKAHGAAPAARACPVQLDIQDKNGVIS